MARQEALGALAVLLCSALGAIAMVLVRKLIAERKALRTIVLYFSLFGGVLLVADAAVRLGAVADELLLLLMGRGLCGGVAQILLTQSYRYADMSTIAPFEYTSILLGLLIGYFRVSMRCRPASC